MTSKLQLFNRLMSNKSSNLINFVNYRQSPSLTGDPSRARQSNINFII